MGNNDIGQAVRWLQMGDRVRRRGWNGKGMHLVLSAAGTAMIENEGRPGFTRTPVLPHVLLFNAQGEYIPWLCSQADLLAGDWELVP